MITPSAYGRVREKSYAKRMGVKPQPASGALRFARLKGDVKTSLFLFDSKTTSKKSYVITGSTMEKICREALNINKIPALAVEVDGSEYVILRDADFQAMRKEYESNA